MTSYRTAAVLAACLVLGTTGQAGAQTLPSAPASSSVQVPPGWEVGTSAGQRVLTWRSPVRVPMGDAAVEFAAGETVLGRPRASADGRTFTLAIPATTPLVDLQARAAGRRLDGDASVSRAAPAATPAPAPAPANPVDPGKPGTYATVTGEYTLPSVKLPDFPEKVEMKGVVVAPKGASGARPLVLMLHGRHATCFKGSDESAVTGDWPCAPGSRPIPSYRGYLQAQQLLASQGYVTVSISADGINGQDFAADDGGAQARSSLVRLHLARWADWAGAGRSSAPAAVRAAPSVDLFRTLLMGHSRGGEGVNRAATDSLTPPPAAVDGYHGTVRWSIRGTVLIGPTIFGQNPAPDVPSVTILPGCDGDVSDLQGQMYADATREVSRGTALHSVAYVVGANHNFFNTEWTPGQAVAPASDDAYAPKGDICARTGTASLRLTPRQQQTVGATYMAAAARVFVAGDDRVRPLLDGTGVRAPSTDPARVLTHAVGGARTPLVIPDDAPKVTGGARLCAETSGPLRTRCLDGDDFTAASPHFTPFYYAGDEPGRFAVAMTWSKPAGTVSIRPAKPVALGGAQAVAMRIIVPPGSTGTRFDVAVTDTAGKRAVLGSVALNGVPATSSYTSTYWGQEVRVPLTAAAGLGPVADVHLAPSGGAGKAWLVDAWGWSPGLPAAAAPSLSRVDVSQVIVDEGDAGTRTVSVPVTVSGSTRARIRLFVSDPVTSLTTTRVVTVTPDTRAVQIPFEVTGNTRFNGDVGYLVTAKAIEGAVVGDYYGGLLVEDDDPAPTVTITPLTDAVTEGGPLTWRLTLSETADVFLGGYFEVQVPAGGGPELSTTDVGRYWLRTIVGVNPLPSRPLSSDPVTIYVNFEPGELSVDVSVPTVVDGTTEPEEELRMQYFSYDTWDAPPTPGDVVTGTVADAPPA